ncbi:MAG: hypothetical protein A2015_06635 [Spirochaetes bacterium GWF1_31_7]|nr:MAG: hypothetical protein A2Y30_09825 [Spirochaetes bacterium GWE1_32_154]OHD46516.1 MAG: hypothetical protein A2015_06635 [Spirochaetes bacterium GWF1_31_7]OHD49325.1 MAG: hypothetical protein A2Y29_03630 [Spirochaetes bacterium GWE2_31_10]OHD81567.1 MAG: hypothetical protein A2355_15345 [Spirochaetes bacterium RIFOXYB1_FULL_32_8]HBD96433.1 hypothetical protein [Spirochaetia bacterium]
MKYIYSIFFIVSIVLLHSNEIDKKVILKSGVNFITNKHIIGTPITKYSTSSNDDSVINEPLSINIKGENLIRRAEIIFFGSLTFSTFLGWLMFSAYNSIMYEDTFGKLRRYQFLTLYLGGSVIAFSVSLSDLFIRLKPYFKRVEFY